MSGTVSEDSSKEGDEEEDEEELEDSEGNSSESWAGDDEWSDQLPSQTTAERVARRALVQTCITCYQGRVHDSLHQELTLLYDIIATLKGTRDAKLVGGSCRSCLLFLLLLLLLLFLLTPPP